MDLKSKTLITILMGLLIFSFCISANAEKPEVNIAYMTDGPWAENQQVFKHFRQEINELLNADFEVHFFDNKPIVGDWTAKGVRSILDRLLNDSEVDIIIAAGVLASHDVCFRGDLPKPVIAPYILDMDVQGLPEKEGASGVKNLSYISFPAAVVRDLKVFREVVKFDKITFLLAEYMAKGIPELCGPEREITIEAGSEVQAEFVVVAESTIEALAKISEDAEAVYVAPLVHLPIDEFDRLVQGLIERKLPSFSLLGETEVERGLMFGLKPATMIERLARRVAINIQSILLGDEAGTIPYAFAVGERLSLNMATCRAIGFYPSWGVLTEAKVINPDRKEIERRLTLSSAVGEAIIANLDLKAKDREVAAGEQNIKEARSNLLPQVELAATRVQINEEQAGPFQAEKTATATASLTQVIFSEGAWANHSIQKNLQESLTEERYQLYLDTVLETAEAYLNLLKAKTLEKIQRDNLKMTRSNQELAAVRVAIGFAGPGEIYRWQSALATSRKNVINANSVRNLAEIDLNRLLNRAAEENFITEEVDVFDPDLIMGDGRILNYMNNRQAFKVLRAFLAEIALEYSPELKQLEASIAAQKRLLSSTKRAFLLPTVAFQGQISNNFCEKGVGSDSVPGIEDEDTNWNFAFSATFPLYKGGARFAAKTQAAEELTQLRLTRQSMAGKMEQRVRSGMHVAGASYAGITQAREAADAAGKTLDLVTDAYSRGVVSIIDLIDAQNTALVANLAAANAVYDFVIDIMNVERAMGHFVIFATPEDRDAFFERMDRFFEEAGASDTIKRD